MNKSGMKVSGRVEITLRDKLGRIKLHEIHDNLVVTQGLVLIQDRLIGTSSNIITNLGIGWYRTLDPDAPAEDDVNFPDMGTGIDEGQDRKATTPDPNISPPPIYFTLTEAWAPGEPATYYSAYPGTDCPIKAIGAFTGGGTGNTIFSWVKRSVINKNTVDTLVINYVITISPA